MSDYHVRDAEEYDIAAIHSFGSNAPELSVGGVGGGFPSLDELERDDLSDWLVVEDDAGHAWGFCCARTGDADRVGGQRSACIVYLFVHAAHRRKGLARKLLEAMFFQLQCAGVDHVYAWANPTSGVVEFFERERFAKGKACVWMDFDLGRSKARSETAAPARETPGAPSCECGHEALDHVPLTGCWAKGNGARCGCEKFVEGGAAPKEGTGRP